MGDLAPGGRDPDLNAQNAHAKRQTRGLALRIAPAGTEAVSPALEQLFASFDLAQRFSLYQWCHEKAY